jgi:hypothetical protein
MVKNCFSAVWPMPLLMLGSMLLGMILALLIAVLAGLIYFFGAMEIMVPSMMTGMLAGMLGAMAGAEATAGVDYPTLIMQSALLGLVVSALLLISPRPPLLVTTINRISMLSK